MAMTLVQLQEEKEKMLRAIRRRNFDLRRMKEECYSYKQAAKEAGRELRELEREYDVFETALLMACKTILEYEGKSWSPYTKMDMLMKVAREERKKKKKEKE